MRSYTTFDNISRHAAIIAYASHLKQPGQIPSVFFLKLPCLDKSLVYGRDHAAVFARLYAFAQQHRSSRIERSVVCARGGEIGVALVGQVSRRSDGLESAFEIRGDFLREATAHTRTPSRFALR